MGEELYKQWFTKTDSNYIPDSFGIEHKRAEEILDSIKNAATEIAETENDVVLIRSDALFLKSLEICKPQNPSEFGLLMFYMGQFHAQERKEESADEKLKLISELAKAITGSAKVAELLKSISGPEIHKIVVRPEKADAVRKMVKEMEKFASTDNSDIDDIDKMLKEASKNTSKKVN